MKILGVSIVLISFLLSACGGGGGSSTPPVVPKVSISGPSTVWSDDYDWSARATASGMDSSTVGFTMSGGDEYIEIDSVTGAINSAGGNVDIGSHRFTISATDASGTSASTTYDLRSDAFIAGIWFPTVGYDGEYFELLATRSGKIFTYADSDNDDYLEMCSGTFGIKGSALDGGINCNSYLDGMDADFLADVEGTMNGEITLTKFTVTAGVGAGTVNEEPTSFYREYNQVGNIASGRYIHSSDRYGFFELIVNADGSFNTLSAEEVVINLSVVSTCQVSGNIVADPLYGLATASGHSSQNGIYDSTFTATGCSADFDQAMTDVVAGPGIWSYDNVTPFLYFGTPGNSSSNGGYNADNLFLVQLCDEQNQPTALGLGLGLQANCVSPESASAYNDGLTDVKRLLEVLGQGLGWRGNAK